MSSKKKVGTTFYRGYKSGEEKRRISTGDSYWDAKYFVTDSKENAKWYGDQVITVELKPSAKILVEGTREFNALAKGLKKGRNLLQFCSAVTKLAEKAGYDAVWFERQTDVGTVIINMNAIDYALGPDGKPLSSHYERRMEKAKRVAARPSLIEVLPLRKIFYRGVLFETGVPVKFPYIRNKEKAPYLGSRFQQDIEPAGKYVNFDDDPKGNKSYFGSVSPGKYEFGTIYFKSPLVIDFGGGYDEGSWKAALSNAYGAKGKELSKAILKDGYDGIVTVMKAEGEEQTVSEIVCLNPSACVPDVTSGAKRRTMRDL